MQNFMLNLFKKKKIKKPQAIKKLVQPWKLSMRPSAAISFLFGFCRFRDTSGRLRKTKSGLLETEKFDVIGEKISRISQGIVFLEAIEKNPYFVILGILPYTTIILPWKWFNKPSARYSVKLCFVFINESMSFKVISASDALSFTR